MGCQGGYIWDVYNFINLHGVNLEMNYPYKLKDD